MKRGYLIKILLSLVNMDYYVKSFKKNQLLSFYVK